MAERSQNIKSGDLRAVESHFAFGENWQSFVSSIDEESIADAKRGLTKLFPNGELEGARFLDIGCGSGLSMLAAKQLGATSIVGIDVDPKSVQASRTLLSKFVPNEDWKTHVGSVFDLNPKKDGKFDIVHSWGVLHHTGDMWAAVGAAAPLVAPGGHLAIALYRKTPFCGFWRIEKKLYLSSRHSVQKVIRATYKIIYLLGLIATGRNPRRYVRSYGLVRGMDWHHDVHDWLGGYPYESATPSEVLSCLRELGLTVTACFGKPAVVKGMFGSHCDEYTAQRPMSQNEQIST